MQRWVKLVATFLLVVPINGARAEDDGTSTDDDKDERRPRLKYHHEIIGHADYKRTQGAMRAESATEDSKLLSAETSGSLSYGYLAGDHAEPFIEGTYKNIQSQVDTYVVNDRLMEYGLGMLFNVPVTRSRGKSNGDGGTARFSNAFFIPYGGVMMSTLSSLTKEDDPSVETVNSRVLSKAILGFRILPAPHIALHVSVRFFHEKNTSTTATTKKLGGESTRTTIEAKLFSLSLLL